MNPAAILMLISELYEQVSLKQQRIDELEAQIAGDNGSVKDFAMSRED